MTNRDPIPVICDRCRADGLAGEDPFAAFGALLDFEPVPRHTNRADGWDAEVQRAYIAALSLTGTDRAACRAVGKSAFGITQLIAHEGSEGFRAAREEAMAVAADERGRRLAEGVRAAASEKAGWRPPDPPWANAAGRRGRGRPGPLPAPEPEQDSHAARREWISAILRKYMLKCEQERTARLDGRIVEADFYLRQMTWLEVALDLTSEDAFQLLSDFRADGATLFEIAETPMSRLMGAARRQVWAELAEPERPEHPPRRYLEVCRRFSTEPLEVTRSGDELSHQQQREAYEQRHREDAAAQAAWEARALADAAERRAKREAEAEAEAEARRA